MPTISTWNVNGLRAALRKGFADWVSDHAPDVLMLQEVRALPEQLPAGWRDPEGWHVTWHPAQKKGYSGVATLTRGPHQVISRGLPDDPDDVEGRVLQVRWQGLRLVNVYLPSGSSSEARQAEKERWMARFLPVAAELARSDEPTILVGDLNIAHTEDDIWNPKGNKNNSGFLPHERHWFGELLGCGWTDAFRRHFGPQKGPYTWWSNRGKAREKDRGWRIDYALCNPALAARLQQVTVDREAGTTISDHAPITVTFRHTDAPASPSAGPLSGKVTLITGGGGNLAGSVAERFAAAGSRVILVDVEAPEDRARSLGGHALAGNLLDEEDTTRVIDEAIALRGHVDHVVHTVGGFTWGDAHQAELSDYERMMDLNVRSLFLVGRAVLPHLRERGSGLLAGVSAGQAYRGGAGGVALYAAAKSAVSAWIRSVDDELDGTDVSAVCLYPMGVIDTPTNREAMPDADPGTWIDPYDLGAALVFAASTSRRGRARDLPVFPGRRRSD